MTASATRPPGPAGPRAVDQMAQVECDWHAIERQAKDDAASRVDALRGTPLEFGQFIAWAETAYRGVTADLSALHRVGFPQGTQPYTTCHQTIPDPALWLSLSPALTETMTTCRFCEAEYRRAIEENHIHAA